MQKFFTIARFLLSWSLDILSARSKGLERYRQMLARRGALLAKRRKGYPYLAITNAADNEYALTRVQA